MRAVGPRIRRQLLFRMKKLAIDTAELRSFLDPPRTRGKTRVGSGEVGYVLHSRNHRKKKLTLNLRCASSTYVREILGHGHGFKLTLDTIRITKRVCYSGRYLQTGATAEFADNDPTTGPLLMVGDVLEFAIVKYKHVQQPRVRGSRPLWNEVLMASINVFDPRPRREGNLYICPTLRSYRRHPQWVPLKHLTAFLCEAPDTAGNPAVSNFVTITSV